MKEEATRIWRNLPTRLIRFVINGIDEKYRGQLHKITESNYPLCDCFLEKIYNFAVVFTGGIQNNIREVLVA